MDQLVHIAAARRELEAAKSIPDVKDSRDKAAAIEAYLRRQGASFDLQNEVAEWRLRAERKLGLLIPEHFPHGGPTLHRARLGDFGIEYTQSHRWQLEASVSDEEFEAYLGGCRDARKEISSAGLIRLARDRDERVRDDALRGRPGETCTAEDLEAVAALGVKFSTIYADPPWQYGNQATRASTDRHYKTMLPGAIAALPIEALVADEAHLHIWTTNGFLFEARDILEAWGFTYKSVFVWVKPQMGIGNYWRVSHEFMLLGVRGSCPFLDHSYMSWLNAARTQHSAKPEGMRKMIEKVSPAPRLELFARSTSKGWVSWGKEVSRGLFEQNARELVA